MAGVLRDRGVSTFWQIALGIVGGGIITLVVSWIFYVRAARGLERETKKLRGMVNSLALHLERAGVIRAKWNDDGDLKDYRIVQLKGAAKGTSSASASLRVTRREEDQDREDQGDG